MKFKSLIILFFTIFLFACKNETETFANRDTKVDLTEVEKDVNAAADAYYNAIINSDFDLVKSYYYDDCLFIGTDPEEYWPKDSITLMYEKLSKDTTCKIKYTIDKRVINVDHDGKSALVTEQYFSKFISEDMYVRSVTRFIYIEDDWKIDYISWNLAPTNEQLKILRELFTEKKEK